MNVKSPEIHIWKDEALTHIEEPNWGIRQKIKMYEFWDFVYYTQEGTKEFMQLFTQIPHVKEELCHYHGKLM
jgi:hypothetical protein